MIVTDIKTGTKYDPYAEFQKLLARQEIIDILKRMKFV